MEIRPHREQIARFKRLHLREVGIVMFLTVVVPLALARIIHGFLDGTIVR